MEVQWLPGAQMGAQKRIRHFAGHRATAGDLVTLARVWTVAAASRRDLLSPQGTLAARCLTHQPAPLLKSTFAHLGKGLQLCPPFSSCPLQLKVAEGMRDPPRARPPV